MKLKKIYHFDNKRQIWRIIPNDNGQLIIEEREPEKKQAYFHCLTLEAGKKLLKDFQLDDKFWVGIESVRDDIIFFHKFAKPDMPKHRGIFAFDIRSQNIIWENPELIFQFLLKEKLYAFKEKFQGRSYYSINPLNGEIIEEIGENYDLINNLKSESLFEEDSKGQLFPEVFETDSVTDNRAIDFINSLRNRLVISGKIEHILKNDLLSVSFHEVNSKGTFNNLFKAVDLSTGKYILEEVINKETSLYLTDSFFIKNDFLFLLFGKTRLQVYKIIF
ncbi:MAG: DUF4905 domain-containing protein [Ignavibacteriaceae bacterium]|jgi:hypothetical protein|nr:DUF4905 domain-containing protein [Ignavibacteriaceae bacterium]MCW8812911.1 DUF4905 domain-containing protein [Chlorobium sp.]MCW8818382.1 DUF4905 domain-containing protein [Ignavibacteriaceae bacterium]MCW8824005.1 DUF4905 domain-containing protein [Ignavibacteriaceae bacterium]MCW8961190.1 DUF4905 domain-containing protein [Ignavibacteriaceae bacterium]